MSLPKANHKLSNHRSNCFVDSPHSHLQQSTLALHPNIFFHYYYQ